MIAALAALPAMGLWLGLSSLFLLTTTFLVSALYYYPWLDSGSPEALSTLLSQCVFQDRVVFSVIDRLSLFLPLLSLLLLLVSVLVTLRLVRVVIGTAQPGTITFVLSQHLLLGLALVFLLTVFNPSLRTWLAEEAVRVPGVAPCLSDPPISFIGLRQWLDQVNLGMSVLLGGLIISGLALLVSGPSGWQLRNYSQGQASGKRRCEHCGLALQECVLCHGSLTLALVEPMTVYSAQQTLPVRLAFRAKHTDQIKRILLPDRPLLQLTLDPRLEVDRMALGDEWQYEAETQVLCGSRMTEEMILPLRLRRWVWQRLPIASYALTLRLKTAQLPFDQAASPMFIRVQRPPTRVGRLMTTLAGRWQALIHLIQTAAIALWAFMRRSATRVWYIVRRMAYGGRLALLWLGRTGLRVIAWMNRSLRPYATTQINRLRARLNPPPSDEEPHNDA